MNISDEAVEAAAKVIALSTGHIMDSDWDWEHLPKERYYKTARAALEAVAPHVHVTPYASGGVIEGSIPANLMVRHIEGRGYREYWDPELGRWVRIFTSDQIRDLGAQAADQNRTAENG